MVGVQIRKGKGLVAVGQEQEKQSRLGQSICKAGAATVTVSSWQERERQSRARREHRSQLGEEWGEVRVGEGSRGDRGRYLIGMVVLSLMQGTR